MRLSAAFYVMLLGVAAGLCGVVVAGVHLAGMRDVARQLPEVVSGGLGGVALCATCLVVASLHARRATAHRRLGLLRVAIQHTERLVETTATARDRRTDTSRPRPSRTPRRRV
jgi:hypothetical protein